MKDLWHEKSLEVVAYVILSCTKKLENKYNNLLGPQNNPWEIIWAWNGRCLIVFSKHLCLLIILSYLQYQIKEGASPLLRPPWVLNINGRGSLHLIWRTESYWISTRELHYYIKTVSTSREPKLILFDFGFLGIWSWLNDV